VVSITNNFLGFEELSLEESEEVEKIKREVENGEYLDFDEIFSD
jgi:anti-sigma28 factor (negative regulator of flagellin synthesis)